ncbi:ribonuclease H-like domain-containing protein [Tanacetum coccineum]
MAFVSSENTSSTNEAVNTAHEVFTASSQGQASSLTYVDDVMFSFFANQSNSLQLDNKDLEQIDIDDLEEMDLKWQVAMLTMRVKRFLKKTGRNLNFNGKEIVGFDKTKESGIENEDAPKRIAPVENPTNTLVVQDGIGSSSSTSLDYEVHTCCKDCLKSYETLQKKYDQQRDALNKSNLEIIGYQIGLESLEARIVVHEKNEAVYEEDIAFLKYDVQVKDISIKDLKNQLEEALKEKDDLKLKLEKFEESSKNLTKLINSQISAKDKAGLGYDSQMNESEVVNSVFNSKESDVDDSLVNDRFKTGKGFHAVPPPYTGNYMPSRPDLSFAGLDDSVYKAKVSETITIASKTRKLDQYGTVPQRGEHQNKFTHPHPKRNFVPTVVVTKSGQVLVNAAIQSSPRAAASITHSLVRRAFNQKSAAKTYNLNEKVKTARVNNVTTARPKVVVSAAVGNGENAVKSSACWIWRDKRKWSGPEWLFDIDLLTNSMNYEPVTAGNQTNKNAGIKDNVDAVPTQQYILLPLLYDSPQSSKDAVADDAGKKTNEEPANEGERNGQEKEGGASNKENDQNYYLLVLSGKNFTNADDLPTDPLISDLEDTGIFSGAYDDEDVGAEAELNNLETIMNRAIETKVVYRNKKDERGIVVRNKARLVAQGYTQEEGINYNEVFAPVARIKVIRLFLVYASFMGLIVYQMDVKSAFLYGTIEEEDRGETLSTGMSSMGELTFFLGLQVMQKDDGILHYAKTIKAGYIEDIDFVLKAKRTTEISQSIGPIPLVTDETVIKEWEDRMERVATTASSLEAEQGSGNINRTQSMATLNASFP